MLDFFVWGPTQKQGKIGWEAWTRTRIARVRVWSPTNWTTSQPRERRRKCSGQKAPATALQPFKNKTRELAASTSSDSGIDALSCLHARNWGDIEAGKKTGKRSEKRHPRDENFPRVARRAFCSGNVVHGSPKFCVSRKSYSLRQCSRP